METEILIALIGRMVEERLADLPTASGHRGSRGFPGRDGRDGKDFSFAEHEGIIRDWAKEFALKFEDLSHDQIENLRGPRGRDGRHGRDGSSFIFDENRDAIETIIRSTVGELKPELRLRFSDLTASEIGELRGPRGRDGRDGRNFEFEDHKEYFDSLRLRFADLSADEKGELTLRFSHLSADEKSELKLKFADLSDDDKLSIRGPRGLRGQRGSHGRDGESGRHGARGLPGPQGLRGLSGLHGIDGRDGIDAPYIVSISVEDYGPGQIYFVFEFSDGSSLQTDKVELPQPIQVFGGGGSSSGGGTRKVDYEIIVDQPDTITTYVGYAIPGSVTSAGVWKIKRILISGTETIIEYADSNASFDNVWDDRASLSYG